MAAKANVYVLYTGGTIGMAPADRDTPGSPLAPKPLAELLEFVPALLRDKRFDLTYESFATPLDSSDVGPAEWVEIARRIEAAYEAHDGFVILHGTDTMSYTASALAFLFENLAKPVVITGSQLPMSNLRTDAVMNLVNAVLIAGYRASGVPCIPEVVVVFADKVLRGCRTRKVSASSWAGFDSPNCPPLGTVGEHIRITTALLRPPPRSGAAFRVNTRLNTRVMDIGLTPGFQPAHLRHILLGLDDFDAVILRTYGAGNAPHDATFLTVLEEVADRGKLILNVTQCLQGTVEMGLYAASAGLLERGVVSGLDLTPEAALTKLMWALALDEGVAMRMQVNQRGEQSQSLFDLRFGGSHHPVFDFSATVAAPAEFQPASLDRAVLRFSGLRGDAAVAITVNGHPVQMAAGVGELEAALLRGQQQFHIELHAEEGINFDGLFLALFASG